MKQKSAILQVYCGQRGNGEKVKYSAECKEYRNRAGEYYDKLCEKLESMPEILELFFKFSDCVDKANVLEIETNYAEGFKFGLLIGIEAGESKFE